MVDAEVRVMFASCLRLSLLTAVLLKKRHQPGRWEPGWLDWPVITATDVLFRPMGGGNVGKLG